MDRPIGAIRLQPSLGWAAFKRHQDRSARLADFSKRGFRLSAKQAE
jgi:hypothetical protein